MGRRLCSLCHVGPLQAVRKSRRRAIFTLLLFAFKRRAGRGSQTGLSSLPHAQKSKAPWPHATGQRDAEQKQGWGRDEAAPSGSVLVCSRVPPSADQALTAPGMGPMGAVGDRLLRSCFPDVGRTRAATKPTSRGFTGLGARWLLGAREGPDSSSRLRTELPAREQDKRGRTGPPPTCLCLRPHRSRYQPGSFCSHRRRSAW